MNRNDLISNIFSRQTFLCVGLDTDIHKIPSHLLEKEDPIYSFNKSIIDATAPYCIAFKPNLAFYESYGIPGMIAFEKTINYIRQNYPAHLIIADAKRGDIGNTSDMYAKTFFEYYGVDALTVAPYMGKDSIQPFLEYKDKWTIILALTSNEGSHDFQLSQTTHGKKLYEEVLIKSQTWEKHNNIMYVVGATQGQAFEHIRRYAPNHFLLVPGIGAQGGNLQEVCKYGINKDCGLIVNNSRAIIYASSNKDFADVAADKAKGIQEDMAYILKNI